MSRKSTLEVWSTILKGKHPYVVFKNGTVVVVREGGDLSLKAKEILKEHGPVRPGSPGGDFSVVQLNEELGGWVVTGDHPDIMTHVGLDEMGDDTKDFIVGIYGRGKRGDDAESLDVIHIEN